MKHVMQKIHLFILSILNNSKNYLFIILFVCFCTAILGDSTSEALLLANYPTQLVANMFIVNALFLFIISMFLISYIDRKDRGKLFLIFIFCHGIILIIIRILLLLNLKILFLPLFSYAYVSKIFLFLMFWTLANDLVDSRTASSQFPFIAAGGTFGAILVSFLIPLILKIISPENLIILWAMFSFLTGITFIPLRKKYSNSFKPVYEALNYKKAISHSVLEDVKTIYKEPLLGNMAIFYFILFFILINQHFSFYSQIKSQMNDARALASFLGFFNGFSMAATFFLQTTIAGNIIRKIGSTRSMLFLPGILCFAFCVLFLLGISVKLNIINEIKMQTGIIFWAVVLGMGLRIAFFDSFFSPNFQIFFSSLPHEIRGRGKLALEGLIKPAAIICAGIWIIFVVPKLPFYLLMLIIFAFSVFLIIQTIRIKSKYTKSLISYLIGFKTKRLPELFNILSMPDAENFISILKKLLYEEEYEIKKFIIEILVNINTKETISLLLEYLPVADSKTKSTIISFLAPLKRKDCKDVFIKMLNDSDERVVANSIIGLSEYDDPEIEEGLKTFLYHKNNRIKANAVTILWFKIKTQNERNTLKQIIYSLINSEDEKENASGFYVIGRIKDFSFLEEIKRYIKKNYQKLAVLNSVRKQLFNTMAEFTTKESLKMVLSFSDMERSKINKDISDAIKKFIDNGLPKENLFEIIKNDNFINRGIVLKSILEKKLKISYDEALCLEEISKLEAKSIYSDWISYCILDNKINFNAVWLLKTAIYELCILRKIHNIIYCSALLDDSGQIACIINKLNHSNRHIRSRAFEVIDNVGNKNVNRILITLLDTQEPQKHVKEALSYYKLRAKNLTDALNEYLFSSYSQWLWMCSVYACYSIFNETKEPRFKELLDKALKENRFNWLYSDEGVN